MNSKQGTALFVAFFVYLIIGGAVFMTLENSYEEESPNPYMTFLDSFMDNLLHPSTFNGSEQDYEAIKGYVTVIYDNFTDGIPRNDTSKLWTFYDAFFLCLTVVTTIGYGNISPNTGMGRVFCVFYALFGIPMTGILLAAIGDFFSGKLLLAHERTKPNSSQYALVINTMTYLIPGLVLFLFLPAVIFMALEGWSFLEGFYYGFITLTTIGFGDYVAGTHAGEFQWIYKLGLMAWIIFGLGYLSMILNFIAKAMKSKHVKKIEKSFTKNIKQTHEAFSKEVECFMRAMNELYTKNKGRIKTSPDKPQRRSSCPSLSDLPAAQLWDIKRSISTGSVGSFKSRKPDNYVNDTETSANFILDLAMALACGELGAPSENDSGKKGSEEANRPRNGSIAQLLTMALLPTIRRNTLATTDVTGVTAPALHELFVHSSNNINSSKNASKCKKRTMSNMFDGILLPMGLGLGPKSQENSSLMKRQKSEQMIYDLERNFDDLKCPSDDASKDRFNIERSASHPTSFIQYLDRFETANPCKQNHTSSNATINGDNKKPKQAHDNLAYRSSSESLTTSPPNYNREETGQKCSWIIGALSGSTEDIHGATAVKGMLHHSSDERISSTGEGHVVHGVPNFYYHPEGEVAGVIEEEKSDCDSLNSIGPCMGRHSDSTSVDMATCSQETVAIDMMDEALLGHPKQDVNRTVFRRKSIEPNCDVTTHM